MTQSAIRIASIAAASAIIMIAALAALTQAAHIVA
jgi:hypothetical protein